MAAHYRLAAVVSLGRQPCLKERSDSFALAGAGGDFYGGVAAGCRKQMDVFVLPLTSSQKDLEMVSLHQKRPLLRKKRPQRLTAQWAR